VSGSAQTDGALFADLMAKHGHTVEDVALECGVSRTAASDWERGAVYPSERYALDVEALFGEVDAARVYAARAASKAHARRDRDEKGILRAAAAILRRRELAELARMVGHEAEREAEAA
jgi:transcriptional regulator with XRE-family HTH domain